MERTDIPDDGNRAPMARMPYAAAIWQAATVHGTPVVMRARDAHGRIDEDHVEPPASDRSPPTRHADGGDADGVGAWFEKGILDTQFGPNRNGRKW